MDTASDRIIINVGGKRHETYATTLQTIPDTRLAWLAENFTDFKQEFFFDRNPELFGIILNYYRTGQLHAPRDFCGPLFKAELEFWGIAETEMEACCWPYYTQHRDAENNLKDFVGPEFEDSDEEDESPEDLESSTHHQGALQPSRWVIYKPKIWAVLDDAHSSAKAKVFALVSLLMILASVASMCTSSVASLKNSVYIQGFEYLFCAWFTLEFVARLIFCPGKIAFFKEMMTWVDLISLLPFYGKIILNTDTLNFLRSVRLIRVFRALKAFAFTSGLQIIVQSLKASFRELILLVIILLIPVVVFSSVVYEIEHTNSNQPHFKNIPESFWWAIITMTTVGYGDMVPKTILGRVMGGVCAIFGVLIVALPVSVIGNNFSTYYSHAQARLSLPKKKRRLICAANLRPNILHENAVSSNTSLRLNGGTEALPLQEPEEASAKKFRRYHRRSRNTLFAHGDVYIGSSRLDRNKLKHNDAYDEENEDENQNENDVTNQEAQHVGATTDGPVSNEEMVNMCAKDEAGQLPPITALPRNFTLINSTHESEEIIEEDTRPASVIPERRCGSSKKRHMPLNGSPSYRRKSNNSLSTSWVEIPSENLPLQNNRPQSSRMRKTRVSPSDVHAQGSYKNHVDGSLHSPSLGYTVPAFMLDMDNTRLDKTSFPNIAESVESSNKAIFMENRRKTEKTNSDGTVANGLHV